MDYLAVLGENNTIMPANQVSAKPVKSSSAASAALRMITMLRLIPREPNKITALQLCERLASEGFVINKRSVERDLNTLDMSLNLCREPNGPQKGVARAWAWAKDAQTLAIADMSAAEALALVLGRKYLSELLPPAMLEQISPFVAAAEDTLKRDPLSRRAAWRHKVAMVSANQPLLPPRRNAEVEAIVYAALLEEKRIEICYRSSAATPPKEDRIDPLGLVQRGPVTYLVARYERYDNVRILAMHRVLSARRLLDNVVAPAGFSLAGYMASGAFGFDGSQAQIRLSLAVHPVIARFLEETPLSADQTVSGEAERPVVSASVRDNAVLEQWLLSLGSGAEVLAPPDLRARVAKALKEAAARYA